MFDQVARAPRLPSPGETLVGTSYSTGFGGKGANQAVAAARLGAQVSLVAKLGKDAVGEQMLRHYRAEGIDLDFVLFDDHLPSGVAPIWVEENTGQNSILIIPGANHAFRPEEVRRATSAIHRAQVLLCQLEIPSHCTLEAFRIAKESKSTLTLLNPAPSLPIPPELLQLTDLLVPNETEATAMTGIAISSPRDAEAAAQILRQRGARAVIVTLGSQGALALPESGSAFMIPAAPVTAVDTTGAGDCFIGSLGYFLAAGFPLRPATERAVRIASLSVLAPGAQGSFRNRSEIDPALLSLETGPHKVH